MFNTIPEFLFRIIGQEQFHDLIGSLPVIHGGKFPHGMVKGRDMIGNEQSAVIGQAFQYGLGGFDGCLVRSGAFI
jgi:hypothetical protein